MKSYGQLELYSGSESFNLMKYIVCHSMKADDWNYIADLKIQLKEVYIVFMKADDWDYIADLKASA